MIYEPAEDSFLLKKYVSRFSAGKRVLDMCSGSGIQAQEAIESGAASVLAIDISKDSVRHIKSKKIPVRQSNLFSKVKGVYDLIVCNPPYLPEDYREDAASALATTGGKRGDEFILRFLHQSLSHLTKEGSVLLLLSSLTPKSRIKSFMKTHGLKFQLLEKQSLFMESLEVWLIRRAQ